MPHFEPNPTDIQNALQAANVAQQQLDRCRNALPRLHQWYRTHQRQLPWRQTRDPYAIWVSEVMLQQTQVSTVVPYYARWLHQFPTIADLARADSAAVLSCWEGLGYYSRALNFQRAARMVQNDHQGQVPADAALFGALPGVGPYTTAAVLSIAFDLPLAAVDGNVRRVLSRWLALPHDVRRPPWPRHLQTLADHLLDPDAPGQHNQALMELGATLCTPRNPNCLACPMKKACQAHASNHPQAYPATAPRKTTPHHQVAVAIVFRGKRCFVDQRPVGGLLGGLWEFPGGKLKPGETVEQALHRELHEEFAMAVVVEDDLAPVRHAYSHFKVTLHPRICRFQRMVPRAGEGQPWQWVAPEQLPELPMPRANRKIIQQLEAAGLLGKRAG